MIKTIFKVLAVTFTVVFLIFAYSYYNFHKKLNKFREGNVQSYGKNNIYSDDFEYPINNEEASYLNKKALKKIRNEKFSEALELLENANQLEQNNPLILSNIGLIYKRQKNFERAKGYMNKAIEVSDSSYVPALVNLGTIYMDNEEYLESIEIFESLVGEFNEQKYNAGILFNLANVNAKYGKCNEAKKWQIQLKELSVFTSQEYFLDIANESIKECIQNDN